jgi:hypothetical protein
MAITVLDTWRVVDRWWRPEDEWIDRRYVEVIWDGRALVFVRKMPDKIWRIHA